MEHALSKKKIRHEPQRTCLGCRTVANKCDLLRFQRVQNGVVHTSDKRNFEGRGAYLHNKISCIQNALDAGVISMPTSVAGRIAWDRVANRIATGDFLETKTSEILTLTHSSTTTNDCGSEP